MTVKQPWKKSRKPCKNGIVSFIVGKLRNINLKIEHSPIINQECLVDNKAHTNISGMGKRAEEKTEMRTKLLYLKKWEIMNRKKILYHINND